MRIVVLAFLAVSAFTAASAQNFTVPSARFPRQVGSVNFTKPCSFHFKRRDASYRPDGSILIKTAEVRNLVTSDGQTAPYITGSLPTAPKGVMAADVDHPFQPVIDTRWCKVREDGVTVCTNVLLMPQAVRAGR